METAVHWAEDAMARARADDSLLTSSDIKDCLACLDQLNSWLDAVASSGELPADASTGELEARFVRAGAARVVEPAENSEAAWLAFLLTAHLEAAGRARSAVRYRPDPDIFFRDGDPIADIAALPGLSALEVSPAAPWPSLDELDPFACNLIITCLTGASAGDVEKALGAAAASCEIESLGGALPTTTASALLEPARRILSAQADLLADATESRTGILASAGNVATNVLRGIDRAPEAERLAAVTAQCIEGNNPSRLRQAIQDAAAAIDTGDDDSTAPAPRKSSQVQTLRIDAARIDRLLRIAGELVVAKNSIGHIVGLIRDLGGEIPEMLKQRHATLDRLVSELRESVLSARMLPLRTTFRRFPRLVYELSEELGKPATLLLEGEDTEADRTIAELIVDPLIHVLRNAMVHGIEAPEIREAAGKNSRASILLRASRRGDHVLIEVRDDGGGIDIEAVKESARKAGIVTDKDLDAMTDEETIEMIFSPGFSTTAAVTELSGRGVGMDAARNAIRSIGGHISVHSEPGESTTVRFELPYSVMMTRVITVEAGGQTVGIPLENVIEALHVTRDAVQSVGAAQAVVLRARTIPLVELAPLLGNTSRITSEDTVAIVVAWIAGERSALRVDRVQKPLDVVLKPAEGLLSDTPGLAGLALLGDGGVLPVLDLEDLLR
jgi:two-component system chemotaxis sensor kinase CheA